jgi:hypothetical protein
VECGPDALRKGGTFIQGSGCGSESLPHGCGGREDARRRGLDVPHAAELRPGLAKPQEQDRRQRDGEGAPGEHGRSGVGFDRRESRRCPSLTLAGRRISCEDEA